ncbi:hypothetical protein MRX96_047460 [Rhipicephalus microplus]
MIKSRMEAIFIISMHTMQNIIGVIRFSYGFHRTGSPNVGLKLDVCLGTESFANILTDAIVIFLLWKEEKSLGVDMRLSQMTRVLGVFIAWNAIALHVCAFGNLMGLLYPPKWYTNEDADALSIREKATILALWAPLIIFLAFWKLYYTSLLYEYYLFYKATKGKPFDSAALSRTAVSVSHASAFSEDRKTFSPIKIEPVRRQSIVVQYREAVKEQAARAGGSRRRPSAADERTDTAVATEMSQRYSRGSRRQSIVGASAPLSGTWTRRPSAPEDNTNTIQKTGTTGERSQRRPSEAVDAEAGCTVTEEKAGVQYQPLKHSASTGAPRATGKRRRARRHSVAAEECSIVGVLKKPRPRSEHGRRRSVAPDGGEKAQRQPGPQEDPP